MIKTIDLEEIQQEAYVFDEGMLRTDVMQNIITRNKGEATELLSQTIQNITSFYATQLDERNELYYYEKGIYNPEGKTFVKAFCRRILQAGYTEQLANQVVAKIEADNYIPQEELLKRHDPELICLENGIFNLKTKELTKWNPKQIFLNKVPIKYNPEAKCLNINNFLKATLPEQDDIDTIYEWFGYCFLGGYPINKMALFIGEGGNGKSQVLRLQTKLIGEKNQCAIPLQKFETNDFKEVELFGKFINIGAEISDTPLKNTAKIKGLSGGDSISASRKFKSDLNFKNETKLIFSANNLPKTYDLSNAFFRRWIYIVFPYKFLPKNELEALEEKDRKNCKVAVPDIVDKISEETEMQGLFNKSIVGLHRLLENGEFTSSKTNEETMLWWIRNSDSFLAFCWEQIETQAEQQISKEALRKRYHKFCHDNKVVAEGDKHIHEILTRKILAYDHQLGDGERVWSGIGWKE